MLFKVKEFLEITKFDGFSSRRNYFELHLQAAGREGAAEPDLELDRAQFFSFELEKVRFRARVKPEPLKISQWRA